MDDKKCVIEKKLRQLSKAIQYLAFTRPTDAYSRETSKLREGVSNKMATKVNKSSVL